MRGVINVVAAQPQTLTVQATSGGFTGKQSSFLLFQCHHYRRSFFPSILAQTCTFPFTFNSNSYTACTTDNDTLSWCSPTAVYTGQRLYCTPTGIGSSLRKSLSSCIHIYSLLFSYTTNTDIMSIQCINKSKFMLTNSSIE